LAFDLAELRAGVSSLRQRLRWRTRENTPAKFPSGLELAPAGPQAGRGFSFDSALGLPYLNARKSVLLRRICAVSRPESFMTVGMVRGRGKTPKQCGAFPPLLGARPVLRRPPPLGRRSSSAEKMARRAEAPKTLAKQRMPTSLSRSRSWRPRCRLRPTAKHHTVGETFH
jgi:hypothetical protein